MAVFLAVLVFLTIIAISNIVHRFIPFVPVPLIQVGLGIIAAVFPGGLHITFNPELFLFYLSLPWYLMTEDGSRGMSCGNCGPRFCFWRSVSSL